MPSANLNPYPIEFIDEGDRIRLRIEEWEATRLLDMVSQEIPEDAPASLLGYSIGRWEGTTLVIETAHIDFPYLVERYTVSEDGSRLDYEVAATDSQNPVEPAIWDAYWTWVPGTIIRPFECEVGQGPPRGGTSATLASCAVTSVEG